MINPLKTNRSQKNNLWWEKLLTGSLVVKAQGKLQNRLAVVW
ncbi:ejection domain protein [Escherichia coli 2-222-05_S3_C1]|nr:ejection domain protein [Escherichia coli 2-222-05_S3_C3]KEN89295.1 ejection domain protein [Escherichia coli 2-222-05_S3_C1]